MLNKIFKLIFFFICLFVLALLYPFSLLARAYIKLWVTFAFFTMSLSNKKADLHKVILTSTLL